MISNIYHLFYLLSGCVIFVVLFLYFTHWWFDMAQHRPHHWLSRAVLSLRNLSTNLRMAAGKSGESVVNVLVSSLGRAMERLTNYDYVLLFKRSGLALKAAAIRLKKLFFEKRSDDQQR